MQDMTEAQTGLTNQILSLMAETSNVRIRRSNRRRNDGQIAALLKVNAGNGPPLPGQPNAQVIPGAVGNPYPNFPAPMNALVQMSHAEINLLAQWANETFGIIDGDNIGVRRTKLVNFFREDRIE